MAVETERRRFAMEPIKRASVLAILAALLLPGLANAQSDPGVRPGAINGQSGATATSPLPLASVAANNPSGSLEFFQNGLARFQDVESASTSPTGHNAPVPPFNCNHS